MCEPRPGPYFALRSAYARTTIRDRNVRDVEVMKRLLFTLVVGCAPRGMTTTAEHPANPDAPSGRLAGPPAALAPGVADISTPAAGSVDHSSHGAAPAAPPAPDHSGHAPTAAPPEPDAPASSPSAVPAKPAPKKPVAKPPAPKKPTPKAPAPKPVAPAQPPAPTGHEGHH